MRRYPRLYGLGIFCLLLGTFVLAFSVRAQGTSSITGKVTGDGGAPVENVLVVVYRPNNITGFIFWEETAQGTTNATGDYQISDLESDTYRVGFLPQSEQRDYFDQYYSGATDVYSATDVIVPAATVVPNINVQLDSGAHIKGKVTGPANENLPGIRVQIFGSNFYKEVTTKANGTYDISGLIAGSYTVRFSDPREKPLYATEQYNNKRLDETPTTIIVTDGQTRGNINAQLEGLSVVRGRVTDLASTPLAEITIIGERLADYPLSNEVSEEVYGYSDANGFYTMTGIYSDTWRIKFRDNRYGRYQDEWYNDTDQPVQATPLAIAFNATIPNINAQLTTRGTITGILTNHQGQPIANVEVMAEEYYQLPTGGYSWRGVAGNNSDAAGHYTICCINRGSYRIYFNDRANRYIPEYYQDVQYDFAGGPETVTMVQVTPTLTTTNINAQLNRYSVFEGRVTDQHGAIAPNVLINLYSWHGVGHGWPSVGSDATDENGSYRIEAIPGTYRVGIGDNQSPARYIGQYYNNVQEIESATDITITNETTTTVNVVLTILGRITGTVTDEQGKPLEAIRVYLYEPSTTPGLPWNILRAIDSDSNGHYSIDGLAAGTYRMGFEDAYPQVYVSQFYNNQPTLETADDIVVENGMTLANRNAQLQTLAQINGTVTDSNGNPLSFVYPAFYRYVTQENGDATWQYVTEVETDQNGRYYSQGLEPGLYRLLFQRQWGDYQNEWYDNVGYEAAATTLTLTGSSVLTINAQVASEPFTWPPLAQSDVLTVTEGGTATQLDQVQNSVLYNDLADSGNALQAAVVTFPQHGSLTLNSDGTFTYLHDGSEASSDHFTYRVNDGIQQSNLATVTVTILPVNDLPLANDDAALVVRGGTVTALTGGATSLLANDSDPDDATLTAAVLTNPQHGTLTLNSNGTFTYRHNGDSATSDSFTYRALDGFGAADSATVTITIAAEAPLTFSKTVSIEGIKPRCTTVAEMKVPVGTTIVYCYTVRNNGTQVVTNHSLVDSHLGQLLTNVAFNLAPGTIYSTTFTQTLSVTTTNIATWTASAAPAENTLLAPLAVTAQKAATVRISGPTDDSDNDTIPDNLEQAGDIDGDNIPNFLDTDADGDGVGDQAEVGASPLQPQDSDNDGIPDYLDGTIQTGGAEHLYLPLIYR